MALHPYPIHGESAARALYELACMFLASQELHDEDEGEFTRAVGFFEQTEVGTRLTSVASCGIVKHSLPVQLFHMEVIPPQ